MSNNITENPLRAGALYLWAIGAQLGTEYLLWSPAHLAHASGKPNQMVAKFFFSFTSPSIASALASPAQGAPTHGWLVLFADATVCRENYTDHFTLQSQRRSTL